jgi:hypothetical protein
MDNDGVLHCRLDFSYGYEIQASDIPCQPNHNGPALMKPMTLAELEEYLGERSRPAHAAAYEYLDSLKLSVPHKDTAADLAAVVGDVRPFALFDPDQISIRGEILVLFQWCLLSRRNTFATFNFRNRLVMAVGDQQILKEVINASREERFLEHLAHLYGLDSREREDFISFHEPRGFNWVSA